LGREYRSVGDLAPEPVALLEDHAEGIARMQIEGEVDVPSEDLREREDQRIGESGLLPRVVEGTLDASAHVDEPGLETAAARGSVGRRRIGQAQVRSRLVAGEEALQVADRRGADGDAVPRKKMERPCDVRRRGLVG